MFNKIVIYRMHKWMFVYKFHSNIVPPITIKIGFMHFLCVEGSSAILFVAAPHQVECSIST